MFCTVVRDSIGYGVFLSIYEEAIRMTIPEGGTRRDVPFSTCVLTASIFGQTYWWLTYPFDIVKTKMQSDYSYKSTLDGFRKIYAK